MYCFGSASREKQIVELVILALVHTDRRMKMRQSIR